MEQWLEYLIIGLVLVLCLAYLFKKVRSFGQSGGCGCGCVGCEEGSPSGKQLIKLDRKVKQP